MAKKVTKTKGSGLEEKPAPPVAGTPSTTNTPKSKGSSKKAISQPSPPPLMDTDDLPDSPASASSNDADENANGPAIEWPKEEDLELLKKIRAACPVDDTMKYDSRVNHIDWETVKFSDYSADECKARWLYISGHLRHYRLLPEVINDAVAWTNHPWYNFNKGGKNTMKHPDQPKKPLTSYMLFYMEHKAMVAKDNPGLGMTELSKHIAKLYNSLSPKKKEQYVELANKKKAAYEIELAKFLDDHPGYTLPKAKIGGVPAKAVPPKLPTPLKLYSDHFMPKYLKEGLSQTDARNRCAKTYRELNEKQKMKWISLALEEEVKFNEEMDKFKEQHPEVDLSTKKMSLFTKEELQIKDKHDGKPEKPPNSGYSLYSKQLLSSDTLKGIESKDRMFEISRMWKELGEEEKKDYNERAQVLNHKYKMKYAAYLETLTPEQRMIELTTTSAKGQKRAAPTKSDDDVSENKRKKGSSETSDDDEDSESEDDDFEAPKKPAIQKPHSSLQMFCTTNEAKYRTKNPKLSQQELTRLMAKDFAQLGADKKKMYDSLAQKSKNESAAASTKASAKSAKTKAAAAKATPAAAAAKKATAKPASKAASANGTSPSKTAAKTSKSTTQSPPKSASEAAQPVWAMKQTLFKGEPHKPYEKIEEYYAATVLKQNSFTPEEATNLWKKVSEKQKKKLSEEHQKKMSEYRLVFEKFVRNLASGELKKFQSLMKSRVEDGQESDESEEEEEADEDAEESDKDDEEDPELEYSSSEEDDD